MRYAKRRLPRLAAIGLGATGKGAAAISAPSAATLPSEPQVASRKEETVAVGRLLVEGHVGSRVIENIAEIAGKAIAALSGPRRDGLAIVGQVAFVAVAVF